MSELRIVFLYAEVVGYVVGAFKAMLAARPDLRLDVVYWDQKHINSSQFVIADHANIGFHARSTLGDAGLLGLLETANPQIVVVSGWMDAGYLRALRRYRAAGKSVQVVCGLDDQWKGKIRQHVGQWYFRVFYRQLFDFMWVCGKPQYHYAQRLGYAHERIICHLYAADSSVFNRRAGFSRRFVFVGRFDPVKGLGQLIQAYERLPIAVQEDWPLILIGDGELMGEIKRRENCHIIVKPFMQPAALLEELRLGGVACLTSHSEQWGVAIHEMALLGFPLMLSSACGAATEFLISGYNGYLFRRSDTESLHRALCRITGHSTPELKIFADRSVELGRRIMAEHTAYSLFSVPYLSGL